MFVYTPNDTSLSPSLSLFLSLSLCPSLSLSYAHRYTLIYTHNLSQPHMHTGQMVLFTAPEDMIFGSSCHIHKREVATQSAAKQLKTTKNLMDSALNYSSENDKVYLIY